MTEDIALLGLAVDSGPVRSATGDLKAFDAQAKLSELSAKAFKVALGVAVAGVAAFGVGITGAVMRMEEMDRLMKQVDRGLSNSGNTARTSALEISRWADMLEDRTGRAAEEVMRVSTNLASFGFGRAEFFRALALADDMSAAWGGDLKQNLEGLARALDDPLEGMAMLSKRGIKLSDDQKAMAAAFLDANDKVAAQGVVFEALEAQVKGVAEAGFGGLSAALSRAQKAWDDAFEDMVRGTGQTGDLRDSLVRLVETISSPQFIGAATAFGTLMVNILTAIAEAAVAAGNAVRGIGDFFAAGDAQVSTQGLKDELASLDRLYAAAHGTVLTLSGSQQDEVANQMDNWLGRMEAIQAELARRATGDTETKPGSMEGFGYVDPYAGMDFGTDATAKAMEAANGRLEAFREMLRTEEESEIASYQKRLEELQGFYDSGLLQKAEHGMLLEDLQNQHGDRMADLVKQEVEREARIREQLVDSVSGIFGSLSALAENMGDKGLAASKAFGVAEAVINTAQGITKALAQGGMLGFAGAAAVAAAGAAQVSTILATTKGSTSSPTVGGASAAPAASQQQVQSQPATAVNVTLSGRDGYTRDQIRELLESMAEYSRDGSLIQVHIP